MYFLLLCDKMQLMLKCCSNYIFSWVGKKFVKRLLFFFSYYSIQKIQCKCKRIVGSSRKIIVDCFIYLTFLLLSVTVWKVFKFALWLYACASASKSKVNQVNCFVEAIIYHESKKVKTEVYKIMLTKLLKILTILWTLMMDLFLHEKTV